MKYAFMTFSTPAMALDDVLATASRYGYDGVELRIDSGHAHGVELNSTAEMRDSARRKAAKTGIAICCIATGARFADPATASQDVAKTEAAIDLAADVGAGVIRVFGGKIPDGVTRDAAAGSIVESLRALSSKAESRGVNVAIETHDDWCDPQAVADILAQVNHPRIGANWDYQHTTRVAKATVDAAFDALKPFIKHVHFHDGTLDADRLVFLPVGQGAYDHARVLQLLRSKRYDGFLSGEWINWEPADVHLPRELAAMKVFEAGLAKMTTEVK
jgi:sugar phosphate isomerase/epimerase